MIVLWVVWSSGLQQWEEIRPTVQDVFELKKQHVKSVNGRELTVHLDPLGRFVGSVSVKAPAFCVDDEFYRPSLDDKVALLAGMSELVALEVDKEVLG